jgi:hypothetical protein
LLYLEGLGDSGIRGRARFIPMPDAHEQRYEVQLSADPPPPTEDLAAPTPKVDLWVMTVTAQTATEAVAVAIDNWHAHKGHELPATLILVRQLPSKHYE